MFGTFTAFVTYNDVICVCRLVFWLFTMAVYFIVQNTYFDITQKKLRLKLEKKYSVYGQNMFIILFSGMLTKLILS